jgi:hypothetical protein
MKNLRENFDAIDKPRTGPVEISRAIDGKHLPAPSRQEAYADIQDCAPSEKPHGINTMIPAALP